MNNIFTLRTDRVAFARAFGALFFVPGRRADCAGALFLRTDSLGMAIPLLSKCTAICRTLQIFTANRHGETRSNPTILSSGDRPPELHYPICENL